MIKKIKNQKSKIKITIIPLLLLILGIFGCDLSVEKPAKGGTGPMAIIITVDESPESHTSNTAPDGKILEIPYSKIPVLGKIFKSGLKGLDYWKVNHPYLVTGMNKPALLADPEQTCLDCHDQNTSCNNCHKYVGVKMVSGGE